MFTSWCSAGYLAFCSFSTRLLGGDFQSPSSHSHAVQLIITLRVSYKFGYVCLCVNNLADPLADLENRVLTRCVWMFTEDGLKCVLLEREVFACCVTDVDQTSLLCVYCLTWVAAASWWLAAAGCRLWRSDSQLQFVLGR